MDFKSIDHATTMVAVSCDKSDPKGSCEH